MTQDKESYVHVYTGNGKGKTTAAFGAALRALGHGSSVHVVQFMKGEPFPQYGEVAASERLDRLTVEQHPTRHFVAADDVTEEDRESVREALEASRSAVDDGYDMVVLDEINVACHFGLVSIDEVLGVVEEARCDLVLTGRYAPDEVVDEGDIVTRMEKVRHPHDDGEEAREGTEW